MKKITEGLFRELMSRGNRHPEEYDQCTVMLGLKIITKYLPHKGVEGSGHGVVWSVDVDELVEAGITEEDTMELRKLGWMIEHDEYLAHFC